MSVSMDSPILLIQPRKQDLRQPKNLGGGKDKEFVPVTREFREKLVSEIENVEKNLDKSFIKYPNTPAVISLRLRPEALAKSHRPFYLLEQVGMRPIATERFGELLLPATKENLNLLREKVITSDAKKIRANLTTIDTISSWNKDDTLKWGAYKSQDKLAAEQFLREWILSKKPLFIERFSSSYEGFDSQFAQTLNELFRKLDVRPSQIKTRASGGLAKFIRINSFEAAMELASCPAVRVLRTVEEYLPIEANPQSFAVIGTIPKNILPAPQSDVPTVAVVDSGIEKNDTALKLWIKKHETFVLPPDTDHIHGTFVAGLIAGANKLNDQNPLFPLSQAKILDVATLQKQNTSADILLENIEAAIKANPDVKVWNCSFGSNCPGHTDQFSQFAQDLDELSDRYEVLFVISAGNYSSQPPRSWPPTINCNGADRISMPAESLRSLTVGSIAHESAIVKAHEPSPFSRRGPGSARTPKPDLTHRGGNCTIAGAFKNVGIKSILPKGQIGESIGTSFSAPLISTMAANVWHTLDKSNITAKPETVKALMVHAAALSSPKREANERDYYGFGTPNSVLDALFCAPDTFTLLFNAELHDGIIWEKTPFPIPACLHLDGNRLQAEIIMTLVYSPPLNGKHGAEYVRANIEAAFGSYDLDDQGERKFKGFVPLGATSKEELYEKAMIEDGFKWSPVKVYRKKFSQGVAAKDFRLGLKLLRRAGEPTGTSQSATVLLSFRSVEPDMPVYADGIRAIHKANWISQQIVTRTKISIT